MVTRRVLRPLLLLALVALVGCGKGGRVPAHPTEGTLLINGQPAANVFVLFTPVGGKDPALRPSATTDLEGKFRLTTYEAFDGAPAGEYTVSFLYEPVNSPLSRPKGKPPQVPAHFTKADTSPLKVKVLAQPKNVLDPFKIP